MSSATSSNPVVDLALSVLPNLTNSRLQSTFSLNTIFLRLVSTGSLVLIQLLLLLLVTFFFTADRLGCNFDTCCRSIVVTTLWQHG